VAIADVDKVDFFVDALFGKERRVREQEPERAGLAPFVGGFCAPLLGLKAGPDFKVGPNWRIAPALGFALNTDETSQSSLFAEVAANYWFKQGLHRHRPGLLGLHPLRHRCARVAHQRGPRAQQHEQRQAAVCRRRTLLPEQVRRHSNNYQFWGGLRYIFR